MGYYMDQRESIFVIKKENFEAALQAIKDLAKKVQEVGGGGSYQHGEVVSRCYSWVATSEFLNASTVQAAINAWRWSVELDDESGNICDITFEGNKLGDDQYLFDAIAPYVEDGYIEMSGEDCCIWRWAFKDGECREIYPEISWE
jgi:hypothetical protein